jgi:undecaprenyl-diphosphatase
MDVLQSLMLGLVQGLTEFIPVSSSGHLVILQVLFSGSSQHLFLQFVDIGTTLALLIFFRKRLYGILLDITRHKNYRLARNILITAIPAGLVGFGLASFIESSSFFGNVVVVSIALGTVGVVMILIERLPKASTIKTLDELPPVRALTIGLIQVLALIPGVSRSGSTIIAGRLGGLSPAHAAEYSFLVSIPIMLGVTAKVLLSNHEFMAANMSTIIISNLAAFVAGMIAIGFMLRYLRNHSLGLFGWYRVSLAVVVLTVVLVQ